MSTLTLYFQNDAAPVTPATIRGAWDYSTADHAHGLAEKAGGAGVYASGTVGSTTANFDQFLVRHVSDPLSEVVDFSGTVQGVIGIWESDAGLNAQLHLHIFVLQGQTDSLRGTLLTDHIDAEEAATTDTASGEAFSGTMTNLRAFAGDTIVVEVGVRCNAASTGYTARSYHGSTDATDLADDGNATTRPGWISFAYTAGSAYQVRSIGSGIGNGII
jgi:hypothetical protein